MTRSLRPTALYKAQRFQGPTITVNEEVVAPPINGDIVDVYWASDAQGLNRTTTGTFDDARYLIVKTKDIPDAVTLYLSSDELSTDDLSEGSLNSAIIIPLTVDGDGNGFGFYKILTHDEDEMSFRNSKWVDVTALRTHSTVYTNDTGYTMQVSCYMRTPSDVPAKKFEVSEDGVEWVVAGTSGGVNDREAVWAIIPPGHKYRINGTVVIDDFSELRYKGII